MSIESVMLPNHLILCCPLIILLSIFPRVRVFSNQSALRLRWSKYWSFSDGPSNEYSRLISFVWLVWSPCCPRDSQESSPTPQFKSISSLALSLLYGPTLKSIHNYWKNHKFDYMGLCWQSDISRQHWEPTFENCWIGLHSKIQDFGLSAFYESLTQERPAEPPSVPILYFHRQEKGPREGQFPTQIYPVSQARSISWLFFQLSLAHSLPRFHLSEFMREVKTKIKPRSRLSYSYSWQYLQRRTSLFRSDNWDRSLQWHFT